jgi:transposase-like protein
MKEWFFGMDTEGVVMMSDQDKGLQSAVSEVFSGAHHSHCCQHLADNIQKHFGLPARGVFWKAAYAWNKHDFMEAMSAVKEISLLAAEYINNIPHETWAQYAFPAARFGHITSNIAESINSF